MNSYEIYNNNKTNKIIDLVDTMLKDPVTKLETYDAIVIETEDILKREQTYFIMNTVVTVGLIITLFQVI